MRHHLQQFSIESVVLSCVIDASEERYVATMDIPGAFIHADMDESFTMRFDGMMAELMVKVCPSIYRNTSPQ